MTRMTPQDVKSIIELFEAGDWSILELRYGETELFLSKRPGAHPSWTEPVAQHAPASGSAAGTAPKHALPRASEVPEPPPPAKEAPPLPEGYISVSAPSLGTFYRAAKPGAPAFVEVGHRVTPDTELCLIEVMKLFTTLRAGVTGIVREVLVSDGEQIERGQPLFVIDGND
ncbi:MAG: acetyl-CoA carboxylase biotin carboxyl carrier protein subunit [Gammaproteobacteria bacterium]|nr:acetyl-CoA carboxylase biotin carboxyl carrier protein subunit [Gammaproteobacteria bacterium]